MITLATQMIGIDLDAYASAYKQMTLMDAAPATSTLLGNANPMGDAQAFADQYPNLRADSGIAANYKLVEKHISDGEPDQAKSVIKTLCKYDGYGFWPLQNALRGLDVDIGELSISRGSLATPHSLDEFVFNKYAPAADMTRYWEYDGVVVIYDSFDPKPTHNMDIIHINPEEAVKSSMTVIDHYETSLPLPLERAVPDGNFLIIRSEEPMLSHYIFERVMTKAVGKLAASKGYGESLAHDWVSKP